MQFFSRALIACLIGALSIAPLPAANVQMPAGYAPSSAIGYGDINSTYTPVTVVTPLPVAQPDGGDVVFTPGGAVNAVLFAADTLGYGGVGFQLTGTWVGTVTYQASDDNVNWASTFAQISSSGAFTSASTSPSLIFAPAQHRYFRAIITAYTSGSVTGGAYLRRSSVDPSPTSTVIGTGTSNIGSVYSNIGATSTTGAPLFSSYILSSAASTNSTLVLTGTRRLIGGSLYNTTASVKFVKIYNKATAPTVGTDTPLITIMIPANGSIPIAAVVSDFGAYFSLGLGIGITGAFATTDTTAVAAGDVLVNLLYL